MRTPAELIVDATGNDLGLTKPPTVSVELTEEELETIAELVEQDDNCWGTIDKRALDFRFRAALAKLRGGQ